MSEDWLDRPMEYLIIDEDAPAPLPRRVCGCVYVVESGGLYKIGVAGSIKTRLQGLNAQSAIPVRLVGYVDSEYHTAKALEETLHAQYAANRHHGEWFAITREQAIGIIREKGGTLVEGR